MALKDELVPTPRQKSAKRPVWNPRKTRMPAVSPPPEGSTTDLPCFFWNLLLAVVSEWFTVCVSPEPELQIHCVFQGFVFFFSNVLVFSMQTKVFFLRSEKKFIFWSSCSRYTYTHTHIYIYLSIYIHVLVHRTLNIVISMRDNDNMSNDESASSFLRSLQGTLTCPTPPQPFSCVASNMCANYKER